MEEKTDASLRAQTISSNPLLLHAKSDQSNQSCIMCCDCGTQSVSLQVSMLGCVLNPTLGRAAPPNTLLAASRLHIRQTLLFLGRWKWEGWVRRCGNRLNVTIPHWRVRERGWDRPSAFQSLSLFTHVTEVTFVAVNHPLRPRTHLFNVILKLRGLPQCGHFFKCFMSRYTQCATISCHHHVDGLFTRTIVFNWNSLFFNS